MTRTSKAAKMAKEMLVADRRAKQRRHRARTANKAPIIRPEALEQCGHIQSNIVASGFSRHDSRKSITPYLDLILAAILWTLAFACVAFTIAIAAALFTHLISK